jgi:acyl-CoA thioesterase
MPHSTTLDNFDRTTTLTPTNDAHVFAAELDDSWASLRGVHGGYMTALAVIAAGAMAPDRPVRSITTSFLRPGVVGPAELTVEVLRDGRSFGTLAVTMHQQGRAVTNSRVTVLDVLPGHDWESVPTDRPLDRSLCIPFTPPPSIRHFAQAELLIDPTTVPVGDGSQARIAGHVRPLEPRVIDAAWLAMIGDWFPPSPFRRFEPPTGGVSIDYTVHIHRTLPEDPDRWLEGVFVAETSVAGIALERGRLGLPDGTAVAETFHTRWTG